MVEYHGLGRASCCPSFPAAAAAYQRHVGRTDERRQVGDSGQDPGASAVRSSPFAERLSWQSDGGNINVRQAAHLAYALHNEALAVVEDRAFDPAAAVRRLKAVDAMLGSEFAATFGALLDPGVD